MASRPRALGTLAVALAMAGLAGAGPTVADEPAPLTVDVAGYVGIDPAQAVLPATQAALYATCLKLLNYPDKPGAAGWRPVAEGSVAPFASPDWRHYTFPIQPGNRFSDGAAVDAASFALPLNRALRMHTAGSFLLGDVVGAEAVSAGTAHEASGIHVLPGKLVIDLTKPDYNLALRIATPYFCALPASTPDSFLTAPYASAGPYFFSAYTGATAVLDVNP
jgi:ABC-type transport system substrate-binding protein